MWLTPKRWEGRRRSTTCRADPAILNGLQRRGRSAYSPAASRAVAGDETNGTLRRDSASATGYTRSPAKVDVKDRYIKGPAIHRIESFGQSRNGACDHAARSHQHVFDQGRNQELVFDDQYSDPFEPAVMRQPPLSAICRTAFRRLCVEDLPESRSCSGDRHRLHRFCLAFQFETNAAFDQFCPETTLWQIVDFWPASLGPYQFEMLRLDPGDRPSHLYAPARDR